MSTIDAQSHTLSETEQRIKQAHRGIWASGDYPAVAAEVIPSLGELLVDAVGVRPHERVIDIAAGAGNAAIPAALAGADVTATDLTPELFDSGRRAASAAGVQLTWRQADAEHLPFEDHSFDVALSCVGVMFAPFHQHAADELVRVVRPGGRIGLVAGPVRVHRRHVRVDEALRRPAPRGRPAPSPLGRSRPRRGAARRVRHRLADRAPDARRRPVRRRRGVPRLLQAQLRPDHRGLRAAPGRLRRHGPAGRSAAHPGRGPLPPR